MEQRTGCEVVEVGGGGIRREEGMRDVEHGTELTEKTANQLQISKAEREIKKVKDVKKMVWRRNEKVVKEGSNKTFRC